MFGMLRIDVYNSVFQFSPKIQQLRTAIEEEWDNIPQATINSLINSMRRRCVTLYEANGFTKDSFDWFSDPRPYLLFLRFLF
jgi:hypothetical protein